jgi:asparagine synthase (glutamine-hydrolysing)
MCGIVGLFAPQFTNQAGTVEAMSNSLFHRGPDSSGIWTSAAAGISLAHRRLSIVDPSDSGSQPMHSPCGRFNLVFNGEIYNHKQLRKLLESEGGAFEWRSHSDTEVLLAGLRHWGVEGCLKRINGMFAFALWHAEENTLFLSRDRMGEKPLYYARIGHSFLFGSELKALATHPNWTGEIDRNALALYMRHGYVPAPWSIYKGVYKLLPAHYLVVREQGRFIGEPVCYWNLPEIAAGGVSRDPRAAPILVDELDSILRDAIGLRMMADVPLGAFLSGGFDSTMVVAQMQVQSNRPVKTFSIGFTEDSFNEAHHAKAVASHFGTDHTELFVTPADAMAVIPRLPLMYDEPFADSSQIPTFLVSQLARQHVTVSLSGDGGDELFCGYNRYTLGYSLWNRIRLLPSSIRDLVAFAFNHAPASRLEQLQNLLPKRFRVSYLPDRLPKLAEVLKHKDGLAFYRSLVSQWQNPENLVIGSKEPQTMLNNPTVQSGLSDFRNQMMLLDMLTYLPDDILTKVDRASMAVSLEVRAPLLDHRLVEFALRLPIEYKVRNGHGKWLFKQVLDRYVARELMERPKMGFGVPIEHWLRGPLRTWVEDLLSENRLRVEGFFDPVPIRQMWQEHLSGKRRWHYQIWNVLMFQSWNQSSKYGSGE